MRWYSDGANLRDDAEPPPIDGLEAQARGAMEAAIVASRSAGGRLERRRSAAQARVALLGVVGVAAIAGLGAIALIPGVDRGIVVGLAGLCILVAASAGAALGHMAWRGDPAAEAAAAAVAGDLALSKQAKQLADLAALIEAEPATTARSVLTRLVADSEEAGSTSRAREAGIHGAAELAGRRHERIVPRQPRVQVTTVDGRMLNARIADVSRSGVALDGNFPGCGVGQRLKVGSRQAHVVRVLPRGLACEFETVIPAGTLTPDILL